MADTTWDPTALEMYKAGIIAQCDYLPEFAGAALIHGSPATDWQFIEKLLYTVAMHHKRGRVGTIVLNGMTETECRARNIAYTGFEPWYKALRDYGVLAKRICRLPASSHTGVECLNYLELASQEGWENLTTSSFPHHQLRCFQTIIPPMETMGRRHVYNLTFGGIRMTDALSKPVMGGQTVLGSGDVHGAFEVHQEEEFKRIVAYAQQPEIVDGKPRFTRHATIPEVLEYVRWRDAQ